jgi:DNA-binding transcriptional regulator YiaG
MMESTDSSFRKQATLSVPKIMPRVSLYYWPPFVLPGDELKVSLSVDGKLPEDMKLRVELISELGEIAKLDEITLPLKSANEQGKNPLSVKFVIPAELSKGTYILQVRNNNNVLDTARLDISENENVVKTLVSKSEIFRKALEQEDFVSEAMDFCSYDNAFKSQRKAAELYEQAGEVKIAARSWQELGEALLKNNEFSLSKEALQASLGLWSKIEDSEERQIAIKIIERMKTSISKIPSINAGVEADSQKIRQETNITGKQDSGATSPFPSTVDEFSSTIKRNRETLGLTIAFVARHLEGVREGDIRNWEKGEHLEKLGQYMALSHQLGCEITELIVYPTDTGLIQSRIKVLRESKKHSTAWLSRHTMGINSDTIQTWENGHDLDLLKKLLDLYFYYQYQLDNRPPNVLDFDKEKQKLQESKTVVKDSSHENHMRPKQK